jgi:DNA anti-recombination protein RmuC
MSDKIQAADAIRASIRSYRQLAEYADMLEKVGSLENAEKEALAAANKARAEAAKQKAKADEYEALAKSIESNSVAITKAAQETASQIIQDAEEKAGAEIAKAKARAEVIIHNATAVLTEKNRRLEEQADARTAALKDIEAACLELEQRRDDARQELEVLDGKLAATKAAIANLLG